MIDRGICFFMKGVLLLAMLFGGYGLQGQGYVVSEEVPDFTDINAPCVVATTGTCDNPFVHVGVDNQYHTVITSSGEDAYTGFQQLPTGVAKVVRLGSMYPNEAGSLTYHFVADAEKTLLRIRFAVVFYARLKEVYENRCETPHFMVNVLNESGELLEACDKFDLSDEDNHSWNKNEGWYSHRWFDWSNLILDVSRYAGKRVQLQLIVSSGNQPYTWEYAYFAVEAVSPKIEMENCNGKQFTLVAPEGFNSYRWFNGNNQRRTIWMKGNSDIQVSCEVMSGNGCKQNLSALVTENGRVADEYDILYDTILQGEAYMKNGFDLPPQQDLGMLYFHRMFGDLTSCTDDKMRTLLLYVKQRYYLQEVEICEGEDYLENGFEFRKPLAGLYYDTIVYRADSICCLRLSVASLFSVPDAIKGNTTPCVGAIEYYSVPYTGGGGHYSWNVPEGVTIAGGQWTQQIRVLVSERTVAGNITLKFTNGCGSGTASLKIEPLPSLWRYVADSVCGGEEYHAHGFHLSKEMVGSTPMFYQYYKTVAGCDSVISLHLTVLENPDMKMDCSDSVICGGEEIRLAVVRQWQEVERDSFVAVGDVYCLDGSILRPTEYVRSGKVAEGVVFWVDGSGKHGWIVHKNIQCEACEWVTGEAVSLPAEEEIPEEMIYQDTAGYEHTRLYWATGRIGDYPAAGSVDFMGGWYVPAIKQLCCLMVSIFEIENTLIQIGGDKLIEPKERRMYGSSTREMEDGVYVWLRDTTRLPGGEEVEMEMINTDMLYGKNVIRAIRSF